MQNTNTKTCSIENCERPSYCRGWCTLHYNRWYRTGDPMNPGKYASHRTPEESFAARTEWQGDCIVWTGHRYGIGYGSIWVDSKNVPAHRYAWEREKGPIPEDMFIDHTCHNPPCVNVEHLRIATPSQNNSYLSGPDKSNGKSGLRNVYWVHEKWRVSAIKDGKTYVFGYFEDLDEAAAVAEQARSELYGEFAGRG